MIDIIMSCVWQVLLVIVSLFIYVILIAVVFPRLFLSSKYEAKAVNDRGIKKYSFPNGRAIVYEPDLKSRKYIKQYILSCKENEKYVVCKVGDNVSSIKYDISVFDADDQLVTVIAVSDPVDNNRSTQSVMLPAKTAYVSISVREVGGMVLSGSAAETVPAKWLLIFLGANLAATLAEAFVIKGVLLSFADLLYLYSQRVENSGAFYTFATALLLGIVCAVLVLLFNKVDPIKSFKLKKRG